MPSEFKVPSAKLGVLVKPKALAKRTSVSILSLGRYGINPVNSKGCPGRLTTITANPDDYKAALQVPANTAAIADYATYAVALVKPQGATHRISVVYRAPVTLLAYLYARTPV